jgi:perosamine synthetase
MYKIPIYEPSLLGNEKKYVMECLDSTWISSKGDFLNRFEAKFINKVEVKYATSVSNGTVALHLSMLALGLGPGDEVLVPTLTYIASVNAIKYVGATPIFIDSDPLTWQMDPADIIKKITKNTKAILAVHLYGHSCDLNKILEITKKNDLYLIEDCAEAFGTYYEERHVGGFGDISTFSFYGNKTITTGEGGMVVTNDKTLYQRVLRYKGQGLAEYRRYWHDLIGYNYRMTNICAAIGLAQIEQSEIFLNQKRRVYNTYRDSLKSLNLTFQTEKPNIKHSYWMVNILVNDDVNRDELMHYLEDNGVETRPVFYPVHTMPMYADRYKRCAVAENIAARGVSLPSFPGLSDEKIQFICKLIFQFYKNY